MRWVILAAALAGAIPYSSALFAQNPNQATDESEKDRAERLLAEYDNYLSSRRYAEALAAVEQIKPDPGNRGGQAFVAAFRATALLGLKRDKEARDLIEDVDRLAPQDPEPVRVIFLGGLQTDRIDIAGAAFDKMVGRFPDQVREISRDTMRYFRRAESDAKDPRKDDRTIALGQLGYGGSTGDYFTFEAVKILMKRGDVQAATDLLRHIDDPQMVENLLIQKKFASLWPKIESSVGPNLENVRQSSVVAAENEYAAAPEDAEKLQHLVNIYLYAERFDEAIAMRSKLPTDAAAWRATSEDIGWLTNHIALALHSRGRADEADALFAALNSATIDNSRWRVSMFINRLELLVADGKFNDALPLLVPTEASATNDGSPYAQQLVRRLKYCTMSGLGRKAEAAALLPEVLAHAKDAPGPTIDGLLCAGEMAKAEEVTLTSLKEEDFEQDFVRSLQRHALTFVDPSIWQKGWAQLRARPAIAKEFERLGRDLPSRFLPRTAN